MRPTERTRTADPVPPARPACRAFTTRELLLTTWTERHKMTPEEQVFFDYEKSSMRRAFHNAGASLAAAQCIAFANRRDGKPASDDDALVPPPRYLAPVVKPPQMAH